MKMPNKVYDVLKYIMQYVFPGFSTLYFALSAIWDLPYTEQIIGTVAALTTFLGVLLGVSTSKYKKSDDFRDGVLTVKDNPEDETKPDYTVNLNTEVKDLENKQIISLRVDKE